MGKKGDLLRAQKMQRSMYTFTREQLEEHDRIVVEHAKDKIKRDLMAKMEIEYAEREAHVKKVIEEEWKSREELFKGEDMADNFFLILSLLLATSCRVLIEKFHWKPIPKDGKYDRRNYTMRYGDYLIDEINGIIEDETKDIRTYCDEVYDLYGVKFVQQDDQGGDAYGQGDP